MDYNVCDSVTAKVYAGRTEKFWDEITVAEIHKSIFSWKKRVRLVDSEGEAILTIFSMKAVIRKFLS